MNENNFDEDAILSSLETFIHEELMYGRDDVVLTHATPLIDEGHVNSMGVFRLIDFLETEFGIAIEPQDVQVKHFQDINSICALVRSTERVTES